jgi:hypothetical protein
MDHMRNPVLIIAFAAIIVAGFLLYPRPDARVSASRLVARALQTKQNVQIPIEEIKHRLDSGCTPILEGSDTAGGADAWAIRLKIPPPSKYPWLELWIDKKTSRILTCKEWGVRDKRVIVLAQYPKT